MKNREGKRATEDTEARGQGLHPKLALSNLLSSVEPPSGRRTLWTVWPFSPWSLHLINEESSASFLRCTYLRATWRILNNV